MIYLLSCHPPKSFKKFVIYEKRQKHGPASRLLYLFVCHASASIRFDIDDIVHRNLIFDKVQLIVSVSQRCFMLECFLWEIDCLEKKNNRILTNRRKYEIM